MEKRILVVLFLAFATVQAQAQLFKAGIKVGVATPDIKPGDLDSVRFTSGSDQLKIKVSNASYGFHFGAWARVGIGNFFVQPDLLFNSSNTDYTVSRLKNGVWLDSVRNERYLNLDMPIMLGYKVKALRLMAGPVAHFKVGSNSDLTELANLNYKSEFAAARWGFQGGLGLAFGNLGIDLRYETNFFKYANHITFNGTPVEFSGSPARFLVQASYAF